MRDNVRQCLKENSEKNYDKVRLEMLSMMSTEERAEKAMRQRSADYLQPLSYEFKNGYVQGATEQKAIDEADLQTAKDTYFDAGYETAKNKMIDKAKKAFCDTCMGQCKDKSHCDTLQKFTYALEG